LDFSEFPLAICLQEQRDRSKIAGVAPHLV
jgi:hypothetical protein